MKGSSALETSPREGGGVEKSHDLRLGALEILKGERSVGCRKKVQDDD